MENNQNNEIDVRKIVRIVLDYWWWFAIGVTFFVTLGMLYYLRKAPNWTTDAAVMLRQREGVSSMEAFSMLGLTGNQAAEDEVVVFASRGLLYQAIDALDLWDSPAHKDGWRWVGEFRNPALKIDYIALTEKAEMQPFVVTVKRTRSGYKVKTKMGMFHRSTTKVEDLSQPIETGVGTLRIHANRELSRDTTYRVAHSRKELVVAGYRKAIKISQHKKEYRGHNHSVGRIPY